MLEHLEAIGWIRTFREPNQRGNYLTLICRASVHDLAGNEYRINADATTDWRHPVYEPVAQVSPETVNVVGKVARHREVRDENRERRAKKHHPEKRDDAFSCDNLAAKAKKILTGKYPEDAEYQIDFGLQLITERAFNSAKHPGSAAYFITSYENLRLEETFKEECLWYRGSPESNDQRSRLNAIIRQATEESRKTGRDFFECFDELKNKPFEETIQ